jgi:uncharacterized membrane protein required for colicin V production
MVPEWLSWVDVAYVVAVLLFALSGFNHGFAGQLAHIITVIMLGVVLFFACPALFNYFSQLFRNLDERYMMWLILAGVAIATLLFFHLVSKLLATALKTQISDQSNHAYGFILGLIRGVLVTLFVMVFLVILGPPDIYKGFNKKSYVGKFVCSEMVPRIQPHMTRSALEERVNTLRNRLLERPEAGVVE